MYSDVVHREKPPTLLGLSLVLFYFYVHIKRTGGDRGIADANSEVSSVGDLDHSTITTFDNSRRHFYYPSDP